MLKIFTYKETSTKWLNTIEPNTEKTFCHFN